MATLVADPKFISFVYDGYNYMASFTASTLTDRVIYAVSYISADANRNGVCKISHLLDGNSTARIWSCESSDEPQSFVDALCNALDKHLAAGPH